jgi:predicted GNAT family acetyltransferase
MRSGDEHDLAVRAGRRAAEGVALALDDERRHRDAVELGQARLLRLPRRVEREREAEDAGCADGRGGPARDARARRTAPGDERQPAQLAPLQRVHGCDPRVVELPRRRRRPPPRDAIRLLEARDDDAEVDCGPPHGDEIGRRDAAAGTVAENERGARIRDTVDVGTRRSVRRFELDDVRLIARDPHMIVKDNPAELRYEAQDDDGTLVGEIRYAVEPGAVVLVHTDVEPAVEGEGVGSALVRFALDDLRARDLRVVPRCPFVAAYIRRHPEYDDLVRRAPD